MINIAFSSYRIFTNGQIVGIVFACLLAAGLLVLNGYLIYLLKKRGEHKLHNEQLQKQRDELMNKLSAMRSGTAAIPETKIKLNFAVVDDEEDEGVSDEADAEIEEEAESLDVEVTAEGNVVRYNRSFKARIIQAELDLKARYSELKNHLLSYKGVRDRMSWKKETFQAAHKTAAYFTVRGKTLCLYLATDPTIFAGTKYRVIDLSERNTKGGLPCMFRIKSDRSTGYAKELVDIVMAGFGVEKQPFYESQDYTLPFRSTSALVKRRLIKIVGGGIPDYEREDALAAAKRIRYNRSFEARIIQADDKLKQYYSKLKNYALSYSGVKANATWKKENFASSDKNLASFFIRGKTLCVCMALDPKPFEGTKYRVQDLSTQVKNNEMPLLMKVTSARRLTYAMDLINKLFTENGIAYSEAEYVNYAVPFVATDTLVRRGLIKEIKNGENETSDEAAATTTEKQKRVPRKRKKNSEDVPAGAEQKDQAEQTEQSREQEAEAGNTEGAV